MTWDEYATSHFWINYEPVLWQMCPFPSLNENSNFAADYYIYLSTVINVLGIFHLWVFNIHILATEQLGILIMIQMI